MHVEAMEMFVENKIKSIKFGLVVYITIAYFIYLMVELFIYNT